MFFRCYVKKYLTIEKTCLSLYHEINHNHTFKINDMKTVFEKMEFTSFDDKAAFDLIYQTSSGHFVLGQPHPSKPGLIGISESYSGKFPVRVRGSFKTTDTDADIHEEYMATTGLRKEEEAAAEAVLAYIRNFEA